MRRINDPTGPNYVCLYTGIISKDGKHIDGDAICPPSPEFDLKPWDSTIQLLPWTADIVSR